MNVFSRKLLLSAFLLLLLTTSCNFPSASPTAIGTILPDGQLTTTPTIVLSIETATVGIPVTGADEVSLQCQFCVNDEPHAVLIISELASFHVTDASSRITCLTTQVVNGRRILLCRGAQESSFNLNVCTDNASCLQFPVTLETCPVIPQTGIGTPLVTFPTRTPVVLTPIKTSIPPTLSAHTSTPVPTQTVISSPPAIVTTVPPAHAQPTRPSTQQPITGLQDPEAFVRWYFGRVWNDRNYQDLWDNYLTPSFKAHASDNQLEGYAEWWNLVERVDVNSVDVIENNGTQAWIRVNVTFTMKDGRLISNQVYDYDLLFDPTRNTWMFDYRLQ